MTEHPTENPIVREILDAKCADRFTQARARLAFKKALAEWKTNGRSTSGLKQVKDLASVHLQAQGVNHRILRTPHEENTTYLIEILPDAKSARKLGLLAFSLWTQHQTRLVYHLGKLASLRAKASYQRPKPERGEPFGTIRLPSSAILNPARMCSSVAHEIVHSMTTVRLKKKEGYSFYGRVRVHAKARKNPAAKIPNVLEFSSHRVRNSFLLNNTYAVYFAFDEVDAHYVQANLLVQKLNLLPEFQAERLGRKAKSRALRGLKLASQAAYIASGALTALNERQTAPEFEFHPMGTTSARLQLRLDQIPVELEIPLVQSAGIEDPYNHAQLVQQLVRLHTSSKQRYGRLLELVGEICPETAAGINS